MTLWIKCSFSGKDEIADDVEINAVTRPVILDYYMDAVRKWR